MNLLVNMITRLRGVFVFSQEIRRHHIIQQAGEKKSLQILGR